MERRIVRTADGSMTIRIDDWQEQYHSMHGAVQEAYHVFIGMGLDLFSDRAVSILEMGFGTGLNSLITFKEAPSRGLKVRYTGIEQYPVEREMALQMGYPGILGGGSLVTAFKQMHSGDWAKPIRLSEAFSLQKINTDFSEFHTNETFDLIYFDAFGARVQPELWTAAIFTHCHDLLGENGILVTYAAKGSVRRAMLQAGFRVERLPGPPGKREMLRAVKGSIVD